MWLAWGGLGLLVGGLLNILISRLPYKDGLLATPLHCHTCEHPLGPGEVFPLLGFALQRGRCRFCQQPISWRFPLVEVATAVLFAFSYLRFDFGRDLLVVSFYLAVLVVVFFVDQQHRLILNVVTYPVAVLSLVLAAVPPGPGVNSALFGALFYGGFFVLLYLVSVLVYRRVDALGMGDVKLAVVIGLMTGLPLALVALLAGVLLGAVAAVAVLVTGRSAKSAMPYGTALSVGAMLAILYGDAILAWYLGK